MDQAPDVRAAAVVVVVMQAHRELPDITSWGCLALSSMTIVNNPATGSNTLHRQNQRIATDAGAIAEVLSALKRYPSDYNTQRYGVMALAGLLQRNRQNQDVAKALGAKGVLQRSQVDFADCERHVKWCTRCAAILRGDHLD